MKSVAEIRERVETLRRDVNLSQRSRIKAVMNGGPEAVKAILAWNKDYAQDLGDDLQSANMMLSGMERLAQKVGRAPTLKTDMVPAKDSQRARKRAEKRGRVVRGWDDVSRMELQFPQIGRWLPGYGIVGHVIKERRFGDTTYPVAQLRDPYSLYPGQWGVDQQPNELAAIRQVTVRHMARHYPQVAGKLLSLGQKRQPQTTFGASARWSDDGWEGRASGSVDLVEYMCNEGTYIFVPNIDEVVDFIPNPLRSGPAFVLTKRFSFDKLVGQYDQSYGMMMMMAKLNILGLMGAEDANFREINIIGEMVGNTYERGRNAVNQFEPGARIEKVSVDQLQQTWQALSILERQFRQVSGYPVSDDGQSPNSFATGAGISELRSSADYNVREYQTSIRHSMELIDMKRLEWEQAMHPSEKKSIVWFEGGRLFEETYVAKRDIDSNFRTKRVYGAMATFDESQKVVAGLQLLQAGIIDRRTMQENMDGLDNVSLVNERIDQDMAKEAMIQGLGQRFAEQDPAAGMALVAILDEPSGAVETLKKLFTPQEPQMSPEEQMMAAGQGVPGVEGMMPPGGPGGPGGGGEMEMGSPPAVQTILSQLESPGGGVMSVGQM